MTTRATPPAGLGAAGRALWHSISGTYEVDPHEGEVLVQACRTADRVAALDAVVDAEGPMVDDAKRGLSIAHPALVESRQQRVLLGRLLAQLRLPDSEDQRPQRRGVRGFYGPRRVADGGA